MILTHERARIKRQHRKILFLKDPPGSSQKTSKSQSETVARVRYYTNFWEEWYFVSLDLGRKSTVMKCCSHSLWLLIIMNEESIINAPHKTSKDLRPNASSYGYGIFAICKLSESLDMYFFYCITTVKNYQPYTNQNFHGQSWLLVSFRKS